MKNITMLTVGSRGDVQPYIALGMGLQMAGYTVRLATHTTFENQIGAAGLEFFPIGGDFQAVSQGKAGKDLAEAGRNPIAALKRFAEALAPLMDKPLRDSLEACQTADAVIGSGTVFWGADLAEHLKIPYIFAGLQPSFPTRHFLHPDAPPSLQLGGLGNWLSHRFFRWFYWRLFRNPINRWREEMLGRSPHRTCPFNTEYWWNIPKLFGYSPLVVPPPPDWPTSAHVTGYWFLDTIADFEPPAELLDFLAAGEPPVSIGFGSMTGRNPAAMTAIALEALEQTGQRGILLTGWGGIQATDLPQHVLKLNGVPHDWLFPKMKAIVHHGGAGTTAAALRSGIPSIVVPFMTDQPFWGDRVAKLGVGPKAISKKQLTAQSLAAAIQTAISDDKMRQNAAQLGEKIRAEAGVSRAIEVIRECL